MSLVDDVFEQLATHGPESSTALAGRLGAKRASVAMAIMRLQERGLVARDGRRQGGRVYYRALESEIAPARGSLPSRVLAHLQLRGPDYVCSIAAALGARDAAVSQALGTLRLRGEVVFERRGRRVYFATPDGLVARDLLDRLDDEISLLRLEQTIALGGVDPDIAALMHDDAGEPARHRHSRYRRAAA